MTINVKMGALILICALAFRPEDARAWQADNGDGTFKNPVLYADYPDPDIIRVTNDFYMVSTTFADSPGINVLHSKDLVNWEIISHCATNLDWGNIYNLTGGTAYRQGFWASSLRFHNGMFYVVANPEGANGRIYYATNAAGPWQYYQLNQGVYDPGLLIDTNGVGYIFYGYSPQQSVATLNADFSQVVSVSNNVVLSGGEGSHAVRRGNYYYLFNANPGVWPFQLRCARATNLFGLWETNFICTDEIRGGHQGAIVDLPDGTNYYGFVMRDGGAIGRMTCLCPIVWSNNWPVWGATNAAGYVPAVTNKPIAGQTLLQPDTADEFTNSTLGLQWQWNHNPDNSKWSLTARPGWLRLMPTPATNFWVARNTLTQKGQGPWSRGEVKLDVSHLQPGDICGLGTLGTTNGQVAVNCDPWGNKYLSMNVIVPTTNSPGLSVWQTNFGRVAVTGTNVFLRVDLDFQAGLGGCSYSLDGTNWDTLGGQFNLAYDISIGTFQGEKYALFCYNTNSSTGYLDVDYFHFSDNMQRGRPHLNAAKTTLVADNGQLLRGPFTSTEWTAATAASNIANLRELGFNAVHLYAEDFNTNYPAANSTAPGYSVANVDAIVAATRSNGLYLVITIGNGAYNGSYSLAWVTNFWKFYAPRYATETHVLYEIQNEPVAWGPPYLTATTPAGALNMEVAAYNIIRANAPNTPVLLFTYAVLGGTSGTTAALTDIQAFNGAVFGNTNAVWTNEAVAFHGYAGSQAAAAAATGLLSAGYPCFMTEYYGTLWGTTMTVLDAQLISQLEHLGISWLTFEYVPPTGVSVDVTQPQSYSNIVNWAGLSWNPDYGNWPPARGTFGNGGLPWTTPDFTNNALAGTLRIEAEDFDAGGEGVAYHALTNVNSGGQYRTNEAVDIETTTDSGGGYDVTGTTAGEWLEYTINVSEPGEYNLKLRVAGTTAGGLQVLAGGINGNSLVDTWTVPGTGGAQTWVTITNAVFLAPGQQVLHFNILAGGFSLNWMELSPVAGGVISNGVYKFLNRGSALVLQGVGSNGTLAAASDTASTMQQWNLLHLGGNLYKITSVSNSWSWNAGGNGNPVGFVGWWGAGGNECFCLLPTDSGFYRFVPVLNGLSVESTSTNSAAVDQLVYNGGANQQWGIVAANAPDFPTGLSVAPVSATQINLTWNAVAGATSYNIKRSTSSGGPFAPIATGITTTNYSDASVVSGLIYYYVVSAVVKGVESLNSLSSGSLLPYPWQTQDIGAVGVAGSAAYSNGVFTATGAGPDIWNTADGFRYLYTIANGNCTITARVANLQNIDPWSKAGVMIRSSLASNAPNAFVAVTPGNGVTWQYRSSTNGSSSNANTIGLNAPFWVALVRTGNTFTGYRSPDGTNWTQQGSNSIPLSSTVYVGLALTSHNSSTLCTAAFDNVTAPNWPASATLLAPSGLVATVLATNQIALAWNAFTNATSYNLKRSLTNGGPYNTIASGVTMTNYLDSNLAGGTIYYYAVSAVLAGHETSNSATASAVTWSPTVGGLIHRYSFNESGGSSVADSVGGPVWNGTLPNGGTFSGGQLILSSNAQQYVNLPGGLVSNLTNVTIEAWATFATNLPWASWFFGFGNTDGGGAGEDYLFCSEGGERFAISGVDPGYTGETNAYASLNWGGLTLHLTCVVNVNHGYLAIYTNGVLSGTNKLGAYSLGAVNNQYSFINRSLYSSDPYVNLAIQEFRVYNAALSTGEIAATEALGPDQLLNPGSPAVALTATGTNLVMTWPAASAGFAVQWCTNLGAGNWASVASPQPQLIAGQWQVGLSRQSTTAIFFRLAK